MCARGRWSGVDGMHKKCVEGHGVGGGGQGSERVTGGGLESRDVEVGADVNVMTCCSL